MIANVGLDMQPMTINCRLGTYLTKSFSIYKALIALADHLVSHLSNIGGERDSNRGGPGCRGCGISLRIQTRTRRDKSAVHIHLALSSET